MTKKTVFLTELNQSLSVIKNKLGEHGESICAKELNDIQAAINSLLECSLSPSGNNPLLQSQQEVRLLNELIMCIENIVVEVDREVAVLESELQNRENDPENIKIKHHAHKSDLREGLREILDRIRVDLPYI